MSGARRRPAPGAAKPVLITGGAGFIGANLAHRLLSEGERVVLYDNLSRPGVEENYQWLSQVHGEAVSLRVADTRDPRTLGRAVEGASAVFHLAAQAAVTSSLKDPVLDFSVSALGTLNVLGAMRAMAEPPPLVFTSTNKVYGSLAGVELRVRAGRYEPREEAVRQSGIGEGQALEFYSPYGCSKGAADQYVLYHARSFGLPAVVFRMSCIYGPHQLGTEEQGWVAHFLIKARAGEPVYIYGDGRQVRDVLFIDDLVEAFLRARGQMGSLAGQVFNIGGGPANTCSLLELNELIALHAGKAPRAEFGPWRMGDQRYYVSDTRKFTALTGWRPTVGVAEGVGRLQCWLQERAGLRPKILAVAT